MSRHKRISALVRDVNGRKLGRVELELDSTVAGVDHYTVRQMTGDKLGVLIADRPDNAWRARVPGRVGATVHRTRNGALRELLVAEQDAAKGRASECQALAGELVAAGLVPEPPTEAITTVGLELGRVGVVTGLTGQPWAGLAPAVAPAGESPAEALRALASQLQAQARQLEAIARDLEAGK